MSTAPPPSEFNPTGVWLDHYLGTEDPPRELFREFAERGGKGIILSGVAFVPDPNVDAVEMVRELGLKAIVMVNYSDLRDVAVSKEGLEPIGRMIGPADAVAVSFHDRFFDLLSNQRVVAPVLQVKQPGFVPDYDGVVPEKPWLVAVPDGGAMPASPEGAYPGPLMGFMLIGSIHRPEDFPTSIEAKDSVDDLVKNLQGLKPFFYGIPDITADNMNSVPEIARSVRDAGVRALAIDSSQYAGLPELREVAEALAGFPDEITGSRGEGRIIGRQDDAVLAVALTHDGRQVVSGGADGTVRLWDLDGGAEREPLGRHEGPVNSVAVTPGDRVVSGGQDGTVRLWDLDGGAERETLGRHEDRVYSVAVTPDGQVVSGGRDGAVRLWALDGGAEREPLGRHEDWVYSVAVTPGGQVVSGGADGAVRLWDLDGGAEREPLGRHDLAVISVAVTPGGQVVSGGQDRAVRLWDLDGGGEREPLGRHDGTVLSVAVAPSGQVVSGGTDGSVRLWDLGGGGVGQLLGRHDDAVFSVAVTPDGQVVSGGEDGTVRVWDMPVDDLTTPPVILDLDTRFASDAPSSVDYLGFDRLVRALDEMLNHSETLLPLSIAITAPWGAGKSSVMRQLRERLRSTPDNSSNRFRRTWYTVDFPAWKYEKSERLWAALAKKMYEDPQKQMAHWGDRLWFRLRLEWSRRGGWHYLATNFGLPIVTGGLAALAIFLSPAALGVELSVSGGSALALALGAWGRFSGAVGNPFKRSLDAYTARPRYEEHLGFTVEAERDIEKLMHMLAHMPPMGKDDAAEDGTSKETKGKIKEQRAIAIFVDDLDRCSGSHVVEVIEAVNQIFNSLEVQCVFILGMDRQVVAASIDVAYQDMVRYLERRNIPLADEYGYQFLSKIVQMSVSVPPVDLNGMKRLLSHVTGSAIPMVETERQPDTVGARAPAPGPSASPPPREMVAELEQRLREEPMINPADVRERRQALDREVGDDGVQRRALDEAERTVRAERFTTDSPDVRDAEFAALKFLDANPRQVKRFDAAFRLQLHVASQATDLDFSPPQLMALAKWVSIRLRWPLLAEALDRDEGLLAVLEGHADARNGAPSPDSDNPWLDNGELLAVLGDQEIPAVKLSTIDPSALLRVA